MRGKLTQTNLEWGLLHSVHDELECEMRESAKRLETELGRRYPRGVYPGHLNAQKFDRSKTRDKRLRRKHLEAISHLCLSAQLIYFQGEMNEFGEKQRMP